MVGKFIKMINWIKLSRKYTFALIGIFSSIIVLVVVHELGFSDSVAKGAIISCEAVILVITVTYLSGQAKIDLSATIGMNKLPSIGLPSGPLGQFVDSIKSKVP